VRARWPSRNNPVNYKAGRISLTLVFAATLAMGALYVHGLAAAVMASIGGLALAAWIATHREGVLEEYARREARGEEYRRKHRRERPNALLISLILFATSAGTIAFVFADYSQGNVRGFLRRILFDLLGPTGVVILFSIAAAFLSAMALEFALGELWAPKKIASEPRA